ncbi:MAG: IMP dehydrogenase, partial [Syntrophaceae bacterium]|nr:IMP dehydrogenase [Syntrophaceae bacterium]
MLDDVVKDALTFDDLLLLPAESDVLPRDVNTSTFLTRNIQLNIPIISAAMDTVTESRTAICLAQEGGIGIIHRNMSIRRQAIEVDRVKKSESGMIVDPITIEPERKVSDALALMSKYSISGVPVVKNGKLVGILTNRDLRFEENMEQPVSDVMTKENLVTVSADITLEGSKRLLHKHRIEKLLVVDDEYRLKGLITIKDIEKIRKFPNACKDSLGRLRVGAAVGILDREPRIEALLTAGA